MTIINVVTSMDSGVIVTDVDSVLSFTAQPSLSGLTVRCRTGNNVNVDLELLIPGMGCLVITAWLLYFDPYRYSHSKCVCEPGFSDSCDSECYSRG